jgi:hypothetical protein
MAPLTAPAVFPHGAGFVWRWRGGTPELGGRELAAHSQHAQVAVPEAPLLSPRCC